MSSLAQYSPWHKAYAQKCRERIRREIFGDKKLGKTDKPAGKLQNAVGRLKDAVRGK